MIKEMERVLGSKAKQSYAVVYGSPTTSSLNSIRLRKNEVKDWGKSLEKIGLFSTKELLEQTSKPHAFCKAPSIRSSLGAEQPLEPINLINVGDKHGLLGVAWSTDGFSMAVGSEGRSIFGDVAKHYAAGFAAGISTVLIGHPFDTVKVKLQAQHMNTIRYRNAIHCTRYILESEGVKGLYKGATPSFVGMAVESSVLFGTYSQIKSALQGGDAQMPNLASTIPAAAIAGAGISLILCPTELVKCKLQVQARDMLTNRSSIYSGPLDCLQKIIQREGMRGVFCGWTATVFRESIGNACFFTTYEVTWNYLKSILSTEGQEYQRGTWNAVPQFVVEGVIGVCSGGLSGIAFWCAVLPFDVAKTRIQTSVAPSDGSRNPFYHLQIIHKQLGFRGLYTGLGPTLLRAFPANAAAIVTWEFAAKLLGYNSVGHGS